MRDCSSFLQAVLAWDKVCLLLLLDLTAAELCN